MSHWRRRAAFHSIMAIGVLFGLCLMLLVAGQGWSSRTAAAGALSDRYQPEMPWPGWQVVPAAQDRSLDLQAQSDADAAELGALADLQHQHDAAAASPDSTQLIYTGRAGDSIAVPPWPNSALHKTASSAAATRLATSRPAGRVTNRGSSSSSSSGGGGVATPWVSAAEVLRLMQDYSHALSALSADLTRARQRAEEVTALKLTLEKLRTQQQQQMHPQEPAAKHPLLLGPQHQQQQKDVGDNAAVADAGSNSTATADPSPENWAQQRKEGNHVRVFIGVYTGMSNSSVVEPRYNFTLRRAMLRATWFPHTPQDRHRLESDHGIVLRFVAGSMSDAAQEAALEAEQTQHGDILCLPVQEGYSSLPNKTRTFFKVVTDAWDPDWVLKMDDDVFLNPSRLLAATKQWDKMGAQYVGCMKHGYPWKLPGSQWFEPSHLLVGYTYWLHAYGSVYAIAGPVARSVIAANSGHLRLLANEDTSVGLWMLAANVTFFEDMRLCSPRCTPASVAVLQNVCAGLCNPLAELPVLHANPNCSGPPSPLLRYHSSYPHVV